MQAEHLVPDGDVAADAWPDRLHHAGELVARDDGGRALDVPSWCSQVNRQSSSAGDTPLAWTRTSTSPGVSVGTGASSKTSREGSLLA